MCLKKNPTKHSRPCKLLVFTVGWCFSFFVFLELHEHLISMPNYAFNIYVTGKMNMQPIRTNLTELCNLTFFFFHLMKPSKERARYFSSSSGVKCSRDLVFLQHTNCCRSKPTITWLEMAHVAKGQMYLPKDVVKLSSSSEHFPCRNRANSILSLFFILP